MLMNYEIVIVQNNIQNRNDASQNWFNQINNNKKSIDCIIRMEWGSSIANQITSKFKHITRYANIFMT